MNRYIMPALRYIVPAIMLTAMLTFAGTASAEAKSVKLGDQSPSFSLQDQHGNTVNLADYKGKLVVLEWFNETCPFVKKWYNNGDMNAVAEKYTAEGVVWLAINSTKKTDVEHNAKVAEKWNIDRPVLDDNTGETGRMYGAATTPHMYIINTDGTVVYMGAIDSDPSANRADIANATNYVTNALDELLAGNNVTKSQTKPYGCSVKY